MVMCTAIMTVGMPKMVGFYFWPCACVFIFTPCSLLSFRSCETRTSSRNSWRRGVLRNGRSAPQAITTQLIPCPMTAAMISDSQSQLIEFMFGKNVHMKKTPIFVICLWVVMVFPTQVRVSGRVKNVELLYASVFHSLFLNGTYPK